MTQQATPLKAIDERIILLDKQAQILIQELDALKTAKQIIEAGSSNGDTITPLNVMTGRPLLTPDEARTKLGYPPAPKPKTTKLHSTKTPSRAKTKAGRKTLKRTDHILKTLSTGDALTIPEIAKQMGMRQPNYLYRAMPRLEKQGLVQSTNDKPPRWELVAS